MGSLTYNTERERLAKKIRELQFELWKLDCSQPLYEVSLTHTVSEFRALCEWSGELRPQDLIIRGRLYPSHSSVIHYTTYINRLVTMQDKDKVALFEAEFQRFLYQMINATDQLEKDK